MYPQGHLAVHLILIGGIREIAVRFLLGSIALWAGIVVFCDLSALVTPLDGLKTGG